MPHNGSSVPLPIWDDLFFLSSLIVQRDVVSLNVGLVFKISVVAAEQHDEHQQSVYAIFSSACRSNPS